MIQSVLWEKASECQPYAERCEKDAKMCDVELCSALHYMNNLTEWIRDRLESENDVEVRIGNCNFTVNATLLQNCNLTMERRNKSCDDRQLCDLLDKMKYWDTNMSVNDSTWIEECNIKVNVSAKMYECNATKYHMYKSCDARHLCAILDQNMQYGNMSMNASTWIKECNISINLAAKKYECNATKHHMNKSCDAGQLCAILDEKIEHWNMSMSGNMWIEECNISINVSTKMYECNAIKHHINKSCDAGQLCAILDEKIEHWNMSMSGNMWIEECNISVNVSAKMYECNAIKHHINKSCDAEQLCAILDEKIERWNMSMNGNMWIDECNIEVNVSAKKYECNATKHHMNKSCDAGQLCAILDEKIEHWNMSMSGNMWIEECNISVNVSAKMYECNAIKHHINKSCDAEQLCAILDEKIERWNMSMNGNMRIDECNIEVNVSAKKYECNATKHHMNKSCDAGQLCAILDEKIEHWNMSMSGNMWIEECNISVNISAKMYECNAIKHHINESCDAEQLCAILDEKIEHWNMSMSGNMWIEECNISVNVSAKMYECNAIKHHINKSCDAEQLCAILDEKIERWNMSMNGNMWIDECNIEVNVSAKKYECNATKHHMTKSCDAGQLCAILDEKIEHWNISMSGNMWIEECNISINVSAKMYECNAIKHHINEYCDAEQLCAILDEKIEHWNMSMSGNMWIEECNISVNVSAKMYECNAIKHHINKSCDAGQLCAILDEKIEHWNMSMNGNMWIDECNIEVNVSAKKYECNATKHHMTKSCDAGQLCAILDEKIEHWNMSMSGNMWIEECNISINVSAKMHECNARKHHMKKLCDARKLCYVLERKMMHSNISMNGITWIHECNISINAPAKIRECNLTKLRMNKSCNIYELCDGLQWFIREYDTSVNTTVSVEGCSVTIDEHVYKTCKRNRSCEIEGLCKPLIENNYYNESNMNKTIHVKGCDVVFNETVIHICNISLFHCKIESLCSKYRQLAVNHTQESFPETVEGCKVDWNEMEQCNIKFRKNDSDCSVEKLCKPIIEYNYNMTMMNKTLHIDGCDIKFDHVVLNACDITFTTCKIEDLCPKYRVLALNHTIYSFPQYIGECKVNVDDFAQCNVTVQERPMDYHYKVFFNGFKISDSVEETVTHVAVREFDLAGDDGQWEYQYDGIWRRLGPVSSDNATILPSNTRLR